MAFWWPLLVLAFAYGICRFLLMLIPPKVPSIDVDTSDVLDDGNQAQENSFIYVPPRGTSQQSGKIVQCYEPATMKYLGYVPALTRDEVKDRVAKVRKAQKMWAKSSFKQRRLFLRILLKYIIKHQALICEISSRDTGKTMVDASLGEIMTTCEKINWLLSEGEQWLKPEYRSSGRSMLHKRAKVEFHPLGVIGAIVSWNYPFHNIFNPMLAAIFSGNGIVIKISEHASWSGCFYFRIIQSALAAIGAPEDLVEVITGFAETGEALVSSVDKVIFVGSPGVGKMGPPLVGKYDMGALCMHEHSEKLEGLVNDALDKGAEIVARGSFGHIGEDAVDQYFPPTVIVNVNHTMRLMQEEAFGPIMPIMKFSSDEEVVRLANESKYGLGCAVFSGNQSRAREIASQIHAGVAAVNDFASTYMCQSLPFGGVKHSGFGRFGGVEGLRACCLVKAVAEDRWWPFVKTKIPKPIQYPVAENGFEFQESLVEALYGIGIWDRLRALVNVLKMLTEQHPGGGGKRRND
ncbi:Aldehyde dehydrogenase 22A1 isoform C [Glycine soja]|uniref:Aldehyde dehydrogenase 22A1 isoform C n=1 Tax=Glycine soja TaxID=3848 RepID=A0A445G169_GLYSO|nr:Aldehyde dehydrogenase 22A1 isoform C [Glycine soja]